MQGGRILVAVCGGIAAYKVPYLLRRLRERGALVRCALTRSAEQFVTPLTLEVLSGHEVYTQDYLEPGVSGEEQHIVAAEWADLLCIAPCTTHTLARLALGLGDDFVTTTALAFDGVLVVAPAMHEKMWERASTQQHVDTLLARGVRVLGPTEGPLASGESGLGRMVEPEEIVSSLGQVFGRKQLAGKTVLISAGPTQEALDPVRYLGNRSSGKMGFALARSAAEQGARVVLVAGPVQLTTPAGVERCNVTSALEMRDQMFRLAPDCDLVVMTAAVSDYRPKTEAEHKRKKRGKEDWQLELVQNPDILAGLRAKAPDAVCVGFAAETERLKQNAQQKLLSKNVDFIVANDVSRADIGFGSDHNEVWVLGRDHEPAHFSRRSKRSLAEALLALFATELQQREQKAAVVEV